MKLRTGLLFGFATFCAGAVIGAVFAPVREGIGNNFNSNTTNNYYDLQDEEKEAQEKEKAAD